MYIRIYTYMYARMYIYILHVKKCQRSNEHSQQLSGSDRTSSGITRSSSEKGGEGIRNPGWEPSLAGDSVCRVQGMEGSEERRPEAKLCLTGPLITRAV